MAEVRFGSGPNDYLQLQNGIRKVYGEACGHVENNPFLQEYLDLSSENANQTTQEKPMSDNKDNIKHPSHYTQGSIETIDYIKDTLTSEEFTGHCIGSSLKYLARWRHKGGIEDLEKAGVYLAWAIDNELGTVK